MPDADLDSNYCLNPGHVTGPWCYTTDGPRWEYCDVPICDGNEELS